jgi:hypothetical protein
MVFILDPIVHETKVSRADLLGDLKKMKKRGAYLEVGGQCWCVWDEMQKANRLPRPMRFRWNVASWSMWMIP